MYKYIILSFVIARWQVFSRCKDGLSNDLNIETNYRRRTDVIDIMINCTVYINDCD